MAEQGYNQNFGDDDSTGLPDDLDSHVASPLSTNINSPLNGNNTANNSYNNNANANNIPASYSLSNNNNLMTTFEVDNGNAIMNDNIISPQRGRGGGVIDSNVAPAMPALPMINNSNNNNIKHSKSSSNNNNILSGGNNFEEKQTLLEDVGFTQVLRQGDVGIESFFHMKEVIRKFCKHQQMSSDKLLEIYDKFPDNYRQTDGMQGFSELCSMVHQLILETIKAQKKLADFLNKDIVPTMGKYVQEQQQKLQQLKRENHQAEMKVTNAENHMKKNSNQAKSLALKSKKLMESVKTQKKSEQQLNASKKNKGGFKRILNKISQANNPHSHLPEEEQLYLKAKEANDTYQGSVMAANYEQERYYEIQQRFKEKLFKWENERITYGIKKLSLFINKYNEYINTEILNLLSTKIISKIDTLNLNNEIRIYLKNEIIKKGLYKKPKKYELERYHYQNVFHSLDDAMVITRNIKNPYERVPLMLTHLCNKIKELNGFKTEGIFRKSAMQSLIDKYKIELSQNKYNIKTNDPHLPACLLKEWLRGLNDSLIPQSYYNTCIQMTKDHTINNDSLNVFFSQIPEANRETIKYLVNFLKKLLKPDNIKITKMNIQNVAIVFGPTLLRCPSNDPNILLLNSKFEKEFIIQLIKELKN